MAKSTQIVYASIVVDSRTGRRESQKINPDGAVLSALDWTDGVDGTPWRQPCEVANLGDTIYYRHTVPEYDLEA